MLQILELFGGIGSPRIALKQMGIDVKSIDYVEIDKSAVRSYNAMFSDELQYRAQDVRGWNLRPDILIHGSPCQDISIAGHQKGADEGSETRSSLMWETIHIIQNMGVWKPKIVIWENVKNVLSKTMRKNFIRYLEEMESMGYVNSYRVLDARDFGLPQERKRCFVVSMLDDGPFNFDTIEHKRMADIRGFIENNSDVSHVYDVTQPSVLECIGKRGIRRATVIRDYAYTITCRQDRTPAQVIDCGGGRFRYLTERECWRLQGYSDEDYDAAAAVAPKNGRFRMDLYRLAGNSIPVTFFNSIFTAMI